MQRAGAAAAGEIVLRCGAVLSRGVLVVAGPGNNGGDAWVVARALDAAGVRVRVIEPVEAKTDDARAERVLAVESLGDEAIARFDTASFDRGESVVIDGLLGTGASGAPRNGIGAAIEGIRAMHDRGALVVALDVPSGLDASTGACAGVAVIADITLTFGTVKRGHLADRDRCGAIIVLDIGLGRHADLDDGAPRLVDQAWVANRVPPIGAAAHKGVRKKLVIVGGAEGMAGAAILAARAALRSGVGMVKLVVAGASLGAVQEAEPLALAAPWPDDDEGVDSAICTWADAVVVGPGLGKTAASRALVDRVLTRWRGPVLLDADALNVFENDARSLGRLLNGRPAVITPHPAEFARLFSTSVARVLAERFDIGSSAARALGATVLLKGVPTVVTSADGRRLVSASGTPVLAAAGSGDLLSGIAGTLLAQSGDPLVAASVAAWIHGRAAERAASFVRGATLDDVLGALRDSWSTTATHRRYPVLAELPAVGDIGRR
jgi:NAD(P)H-hydrate epimerase